jgi:hypothetical protein
MQSPREAAATQQEGACSLREKTFLHLSLREHAFSRRETAAPQRDRADTQRETLMQLIVR